MHLWSLPLLLIAVWPQAWAASLAMFVMGVANPVVDVSASTILQRLPSMLRLRQLDVSLGAPEGLELLRDVPRTATVTSEEPMVLLALNRQHFLDAVTGNSEVNNRADDLISQRIPMY